MRLQTHGYDNVHVRHGDGTQGWPEAAPFDAIVAAAAGPDSVLVMGEDGGVFRVIEGLWMNLARRA